MPRAVNVPDLSVRTGLYDECSVPTYGVAWADTRLSNIESLLVWCIDLPAGACKDDVSLETGERLFFSTRVWAKDAVKRLSTETLPPLLEELRRDAAREQTLDGGPLALKKRIEQRMKLEARVDALHRGLPPDNVATADVPAGVWSGAKGGLIVAQEGQISVMRLAPRGIRNAWIGNPFEQVPEYGVVGSFKMTPC
jgi:hypothetical protein